ARPKLAAFFSPPPGGPKVAGQRDCLVVEVTKPAAIVTIIAERRRLLGIVYHRWAVSGDFQQARLSVLDDVPRAGRDLDAGLLPIWVLDARVNRSAETLHQ